MLRARPDDRKAVRTDTTEVTMTKSLSWLFVALLLSTLAGCSSGTEEPAFLIGRWQGDDEILVFSPGGVLERFDVQGGATGTGTWRVSGQELSLSIEPDLDAVCAFTLDNIRLGLTPSDRCRLGTETLRRIPN
jgi:hypothetical protein